MDCKEVERGKGEIVYTEPSRQEISTFVGFVRGSYQIGNTLE